MSKQESGLSIKRSDELYERVAEWYSKIHLHYLIAAKCFNREFAIISPEGIVKRNLRVHNAQRFQFVMRCWNVMSKLERGKGLEKFYRSAAVYEKGLPYSNNDLTPTPQIFRWNSDHFKSMTGYDMFIDIDEHKFDQFSVCKETMQLVHEYFEKIKMPHEINFSGRGFHVVVPHQFMPKKTFDLEAKDNIYQYCLKMAKTLNDKVSELVDTRVYEPRQLIKCPYTLAAYDSDLYVCTPLTDEKEIYNCKKEDFTPEEVDIAAGFKLFCDTKVIK